MFTVESYGISDIGLVRTNNEDAWAALPACYFFVLADGMGGHKAGEVAARETVQRLSSSIEKLCQTEPADSTSERAKQLHEAIARVNREVYFLSVKKAEYAGMGTTLACLLIHGDILIYAHVGDSRIYRFRNKSLTKLTQDHSLRQEMLVKKNLHEKSSALNAVKNILTRAIGTQANVIPEIESSRLQDGDIYFLCSDGLTDELTFDEISSILLKAKTIKAASDNLVAAALAKGGSDNITVVMVKVHENETDLSRQ